MMQGNEKNKPFVKTVADSFEVFCPSGAACQTGVLPGEEPDTFVGQTKYSGIKSHKKQWPFFTSANFCFRGKAFLFT